MKRIPLWIDLRGVSAKHRIPYRRAAQRIEAEALLVAPGDAEADRDDALVVDGDQLLHQGIPAGRHVVIERGRDQDIAARVEGIVLVEGKQWSIIPLENLIAARRDRPGTLYALARTPQQCGVFRDTLEHGVHGVALAPASVEDIEEADRILRAKGVPDLGRPARSDEDPGPKNGGEDGGSANDGPGDVGTGQAAPTGAGRRAPRAGAGTSTKTAAVAADATAKTDDTTDDEAADVPETCDQSSQGTPQGTPVRGRTSLVTGRITHIDDAGPGDRVCIDSTSLFHDGEGLLVGSTARGFVLVHAETIESEYVRARPFRVNAGAVHSYLFGPDGKTRYLSELQTGDQVMAVARSGATRALMVGRAKIERRPHTLIRWAADEGEGSAILQTAETIRLIRPDGDVVVVTDLAVGDEVLVHHESSARHFGMPVDEALEER